MSKGTILVVDDEASVRAMLRLVLSGEGYTILEAEDGDEGVARILAHRPDLVLMDVRMPRLDGLSAFLRIRKQWGGVFILMTAFASVNDAVEAIKAGVSDYILKPFNIEELKTLIACSLQTDAPATPDDDGGSRRPLFPETNRSPAIQAILFEANQVAPTNATVLIFGESGTGKEVFANHIHYASSRASGPFIKVNCGALPENLLDSEMFGHEKGAFTSAVSRRLGRFERADTGTLFLDEVGEMPHSLQVKLLRVLQEHEFERLGGDTPIHTDVRIIAATNRSPEELVRTGKLRHDLYYRLAVVTLELPPLRMRREDILPLAELFLARFNKNHGKDVREITADAAAALARYDWPGNIRELSNVMERAVIMNPGRRLLPASLPAHLTRASAIERLAPLPPAPTRGDLRETLKSTEKQTLLAALERNGWNRSKTARDLGMSRRALLYKITEYGLKNS